MLQIWNTFQRLNLRFRITGKTVRLIAYEIEQFWIRAMRRIRFCGSKFKYYSGKWKQSTIYRVIAPAMFTLPILVTWVFFCLIIMYTIFVVWWYIDIYLYKFLMAKIGSFNNFILIL